MAEDHISVIDAAQELGMGKTGVFKVLRRLGVETFKQNHPNHAGQAIAYITMDDFATLQREISSRQSTPINDSSLDSDDATTINVGVFYLIQLEPDHDSGRFKVGFASNINERLRAHRCSAPFAIEIKTWQCKRKWEGTAIDCVTSSCEQLHTEVFRTAEIQSVVTKCDQFFELMPKL